MQRMSIRKLWTVLIPMMTVCSLLALTSFAWADDDNATRRCSNRTLFGAYGLTIEGVIAEPGGTLANGGGLPVRGVVRQTYDGNGHITQVDHVVINGTAPPVEWRPSTGTYSVNPDCTGKATLNLPGGPPLQLFFVITEEGKRLRQVVNGNAISATGERLR